MFPAPPGASFTSSVTNKIIHKTCVSCNRCRFVHHSNFHRHGMGLCEKEFITETAAFAFVLKIFNAKELIIFVSLSNSGQHGKSVQTKPLQDFAIATDASTSSRSQKARLNATTTSTDDDAPWKNQYNFVEQPVRQQPPHLLWRRKKTQTQRPPPKVKSKRA